LSSLLAAELALSLPAQSGPMEGQVLQLACKLL